MRLKKKMKKIIKQIEIRKKNYDNLSEEEREDFWEVLDMIEIFMDYFNYPIGLIDIPTKITEL